MVASVDVEGTTWTSIHIEWASISKRYNFLKKGQYDQYVLLPMVDWEISTGREEFYLALNEFYLVLNDAVDKSCTVELQFKHQSLNQATKLMTR